MIHYSLICDDGHGFESWFRDSAAFDAQAAKGLINCPFCQLDQDRARCDGAERRAPAGRYGRQGCTANCTRFAT